MNEFVRRGQAAQRAADDAIAEAEKKIWWGYLHRNGRIVVRHYRGEWGARAIKDARESEFVLDVHGPFEAPSLAAALEVLKKELRP